MTVGDLYTTFMAVLLTFILGSALGSYHGYKFRRFLPWIELCSGLYSFLIYAMLSGPFYEWDLPLWLVVLGLLPPALALGTHIPLYSYYLRQIRFGLVYGFYHGGAILGLIAFEWNFVHAGSVKNSMLFLGLCQCTLGLVLLKYFRENKFHIDADSFKPESFKSWFQRYGSSAATVFIASTLSFYGVLWALKTQTSFTEAFRLHATLISAAVFIWMSFAGVASKWIKTLSRFNLFFILAFCFLFQQTSFQFLPVGITDLFSGSMQNYFGISLLLALYLTLPVFTSSLIFIAETARLSKNIDVDQASGGLNLFSSFGNISGFVLGGFMAPYFWHRPYLAVALSLSLILSVIFLLKSPRKKAGLIGLMLLLIISPFAFIKEQKDFLYVNRIPKAVRPYVEFTDVDIYAHALSSMSLISKTFKNPTENIPADILEMHPFRRHYIVDGHFSHNIVSGMEIMSGISAAKFFTGPINHSLVIGIGSGQAAWAISAISQKTDMVEISPTVLNNLKVLKEYNNDLHEREDLHIFMKDGFSFIRHCTPGSYDLILNTATYPSNFNASKLYSEEFVALAKKCLSPNGVFQTYFDYYTVVNMDQFHEFLAPLAKHFKYIDIQLEPYPLVFAYDIPRQIHSLTEDDVLRPDDKVFYNKFKSDKKLFQADCQRFLRNPSRPNYSPRMNTLDNAYLEANSLRNMVTSFSNHFDFLEVEHFYLPPSGQSATFTCE